MAVPAVNQSKLLSQRFGLLVVNGQSKWLPSGFGYDWGQQGCQGVLAVIEGTWLYTAFECHKM